MRVPVSKAYRAFPELDGFTDAQCDQFVKLANRRRWLSMVISTGVGMVAMLVVGIGGGALARFVYASMVSLGVLRRVPIGLLDQLIECSPVIVGLCAGSVAAFMIRDRWL